MSTTNVPITLGLMTWGEEGTEGSRVTKLEDCEKMLDVFQKHGHNEVDTARAYTAGTSEQYLGKIDWSSRHLVVDTKLVPFPTHSRADIRKGIDAQLKALQTDSVDMWYLHAPDRTTPFEETLAAVDELYKEGRFKRFGISNYAAWEVAHIVGLCDKHGWIKPTAYQGLYNAVHRNVEPELFPCLRKLGLSFYEFNPLGGGFFTGRYSRHGDIEKGSRFDPDRHRRRYWHEQYFEALELVQAVAEKHSLTLAEIALRWISHHSLLSREKGDNILIGASSVEHLEANLIDFEKGPLEKEVLEVLDKAWEHVRSVATPYFH